MVWPLKGEVQSAAIRQCPRLPFSPYHHVPASRTVYPPGIEGAR